MFGDPRLGARVGILDLTGLTRKVKRSALPMMWDIGSPLQPCPCPCAFAIQMSGRTEHD
jgi:hypothetical protein